MNEVIVENKINFFTYINKDEYNKYNGMFSKENSQYNCFYDLIKEDVSHLKGYFFFYKGIRGSVEMISPLEYLKICANNMSYDDIFSYTYDTNKRDILEAVDSGNLIDMPFYIIGNGTFSQEGRNRSVVSYELGEKLIPVARIYDVSKSEKIQKLKDMISVFGTSDLDEVLLIMKGLNYHSDAIIFMKSYLKTGNIDNPFCVE